MFVVKPSEMGNLNQIIEAVTRDGYVIAQEYLPAAKKGDTRLFLMNGGPLEVDGKYAAFRRMLRQGRRPLEHPRRRQDAPRRRSPTRCWSIAEIVRPKLVRDGMFLVGLDIVGDKLMEINVFSPGGLGSAAKFEKVDFDDGGDRRPRAQGPLSRHRAGPAEQPRAVDAVAGRLQTTMRLAAGHGRRARHSSYSRR